MARKKTDGGEPGGAVENLLPDLGGPADVPDPQGARDALDAPVAGDPAPAGQQEPASSPEAPGTPPVKRGRGRPKGSGKRPSSSAPRREPGVVGEIRPDSKAALQERIRELEAQVPSNLELVTQSLEGTAGVVSILLARVFGDAAKLSKDECHQLAVAWAIPAAPYLDSDTAKYLPWITALGVTFNILEPKYQAIQAQRALTSGSEHEIVVEAVPAAPAPLEPEPLP